MGTTIRKISAAAAVVAVAAFGAPSADAVGQLDPFTLYANVVQADLHWNLADMSAAMGDNITCDPQPVVDGRMVNPRIPVVVGEAYANVEVAGHLKCVSLDTKSTFTLKGVVTDRYYYAGAYQSGGGGLSEMRSVTGVATVNPVAVIPYAGGHGALNTWHYTQFVGTTSTGRVIRGSSPLFYVAGV